MSFALSCIFNSVFGAAIGAITNEFAIRVIFRCIIPKKKKVLAASVQKVVAEELMASDKIRARLSDPQVTKMALENISVYLDKFFSKEQPSTRDLLIKFNLNVADFVNESIRIVLAEIDRHLQNETFVEKAVKPFVRKEMQTLALLSPKSLVPDLVSKAEKSLPKMVDRLMHSGEFRSNFIGVITPALKQMLLSERPVRRILPDTLASDLKEFLFEKTPAILLHIAAILRDRRSDVESFVLDAYNDAKRATWVPDFFIDLTLEDNVKEFAASIPDKLSDFATSTKVHKVRPYIHRFVDDFMSRPVCDIIPDVHEDKLHHSIDRLCARFITDEVTNRVAVASGNFVTGFFDRTLASTVVEWGIPYDEERIVDAVTVKLMSIMKSSETKKQAENHLRKIVEVNLDRKIGKLKSIISSDTIQNIAVLLTDEIIEVFQERFDHLIEEAGMWDIISKSIISYDDKEIERLIREIANRELIWVTVVGGIIGAAIGLGQTFIVYCQ